MSSAKTRSVLVRLGKDLRAARLRRGMAISDLAVRAGTSTSTIIRMEKGEAGVGIGTLADILVVFGLNERLADLIDVRHDDLGLALSNERLPQRGRSFSARLRRHRSDQNPASPEGDTNADGLAF
ncbi:XRE family transcriptional regulator [Sphingomonas hengshuiensis]|uniref:XRE family transcriptional regulator n=2 Tax=Sphingomonas hengshuiensis TaxID=1609977 RepID=A0A7U5BF84_9SPHN|nr:XRE family transcriptional regulator [Sphingomonas hengshuiensis]